MLKVKALYYTWLVLVFLLNTLLTHAQSLQVKIVSDNQNDRFCEGAPEYFYLSADPSGGKEPYRYEWTTSWDDDTLRDKEIRVRPETSGTVKVTVTDNSHPAKSKDAIFQIREVFLEADFSFAPDSVCAQSPILFNPEISGGTQYGLS